MMGLEEALAAVIALQDDHTKLRAFLSAQKWDVWYTERQKADGSWVDWYYRPPGGGTRLRSLAAVVRWYHAAKAVGGDDVKGAGRMDQVVICQNNDKPKDIATALGVDVAALIAANAAKYPGIKASSRLIAGTELIIPKKKRKRKIKKKRAPSRKSTRSASKGDPSGLAVGDEVRVWFNESRHTVKVARFSDTCIHVVYPVDGTREAIDRTKLAGRLAEEGGGGTVGDDSDGDDPLDLAAALAGAPLSVLSVDLVGGLGGGDARMKPCCAGCGQPFEADDNYCDECGKPRKWGKRRRV